MNCELSKFAIPNMCIGKFSYSSYSIISAIGLLLSVLFVVVLGDYKSLDVYFLVICVIYLLCVFYLCSFSYKMLFRVERYVYYRNLIILILSLMLVLPVLKERWLEYVEVLILGVGLLQSIGRMGCFMVGCCHGIETHKKCHVKYGLFHVASGFPKEFSNRPLVPVQLIEMFWALGSVLAALLLIISYSHTGIGLWSYLLLYSFGRFGIEFLRGDKERPSWLTLSEAQWTSICIFVLATLIFYRSYPNAA